MAASDYADTDNVTTAGNGSLENVTSADDVGGGGPIPLTRIFVCLVLFVIVIVTILGNIVVIAAFVIEKKLRTTFTFYILNLAITDILVAVTAMSFYTFDILLGWWPFGQVICGFWIFFDYGMTFSSVFTLVAISIDRFWSVQWSVNYRQHNTMRKTSTVIAVIWLAVLVVWLAPCIVDRIRWSEPYVCIWEPSKNREFVVFIAIVGHHLPDIIMILCFARVFVAMRKRRNKLKAGKPSEQISVVTHCVQADNTSKVAPHGGADPVTVDGVSSQVATSSNMSLQGAGMTTAAMTAAADQRDRLAREQERYNQERKSFITLAYIIFSYLACWVPFHFVFDLSAIDPERVPAMLYTATFWLTYFNSTINPFLYAYSNRDFQNAFRRVVKGQF